MINPLKIQLDITDYNLLVLNDLMRLFIIQLTTQILFKMNNESTILFSKIFIESTLFILLGVLVYWLIFNHLIIFTNNENGNINGNINDYYQSVYINHLKS